MEKFKDLLIRLRKEKELTIRELSTKSGITTVSLSRLEKGKQRPTAQTIYKLSRALNCEYNLLYNSTLIK